MRVDTGVEQGDEITPHYDPMIAKLIVWGADRRQALARMRQALAQYRVVGVSNNVDFLARLVAVPSFANADLDTGLIEREQALAVPARRAVPVDVWLLAALAELLREQRSRRTRRRRSRSTATRRGARSTAGASTGAPSAGSPCAWARSCRRSASKSIPGGLSAEPRRRSRCAPAARSVPTASCTPSSASAGCAPRWWPPASGGTCSSRAARGRCRWSTRCTSAARARRPKAGCGRRCPAR